MFYENMKKTITRLLQWFREFLTLPKLPELPFQLSPTLYYVKGVEFPEQVLNYPGLPRFSQEYPFEGHTHVVKSIKVTPISFSEREWFVEVGFERKPPDMYGDFI